ncbi:MAG: HEAT repeat domain-containing protein [Planctomycetaceae bacterium]
MQNFRALACIAASVVTGSVGGASDLIVPPRNIEAALESYLDRPFVVYTRDPTMPCFSDYVPRREEADARQAVRFATNEYEPVQLGLYVPSTRLASLTGVTIEVRCELPLTIGYLYYEPNARRRVLDFGRIYDHRRPSMPLYVIPGNSIAEIRPGRSAAFWVTFGNRQGVEPGDYKASIIITAEGIDPIEREVEIHVHSFALPRPKAAFGCYYRIDRVPVYDGRKYQEMYIRDQAEHGHNCAQIISTFSSFGMDEYQIDGKVPAPEWIVKWRDLLNPSDFARGVINPAQFIEIQMEMCQQAGLTFSDLPVFGVQDNPAGPRKPFVAETLRRLTVEKNWPEILLYMRDEPPTWINEGFSREFVENITEYKRLRNCRTVAAMSGESAVTWGHLHDVWIVLGGYPTPEMVQEAGRQNAQAWTYLYDLRITNAVANRYYAGLYTWGLELNGNVPYAYHHGEVGQPHPVYLPQEQRPSREQILGFILPGPDGPIPGVGYEGRREGIDDYRYLQLLEARVAEADAQSDVKVAAEKWLTNLKSQIQRSAVRGVLLDFVTLWDLDWMNPDPDIDPSHYQTIREVATRFIEQLPSAPGEANRPPEFHELPDGGLEGAAFDGKSLEECLETLENGTTAEKRAAACAIALRSTSELKLVSTEALVATLEDPEVRIPALRALRAMGSAAVKAIPAIKAQLRHPDPFVRMHGLLVLDAIGPAAIDVIAESLADTFPGIAGLAAHSLGRKGRLAVSALPALERALQSSNPRVRGQVITSMRAIRGE